MTIIRLHRHPFSGEPPQVFQAESLALWLLDRYEHGPAVTVQVFAGEPSAQTEITDDHAAILRGDAAAYTVLESPGGPIAPILINLAISMVLSLAVNFLFAKDPKPLDNRSQESPNNQLSNRENRVRALERVEDIYGTVRSIPSLLMPTYFKYVNNRKVEYGLYCIGRGYYDVADLRDGDTLLSEISGASAAIYAPFTSPNSGSPQATIGPSIIDPIVSVTRSNSVEGIALKAQNQLQLKSPSLYYFRGAGTSTGFLLPLPETSQDLLWQPTNDRKPNVAAVSEVGQSITISMGNYTTERSHAPGTVSVTAATNTYTSTVAGSFRGVVDGSLVTITGGFFQPEGFEPVNVGTKTVVSHTDNSITVAETCVDETNSIESTSFTLVINYSGTRTIAEVQSGYLVLVGHLFAPFPDAISANVSVANGLADWTGWITLPSTDRTEVWTNVLARSGMYKDDGAKQVTSVSYEVQVERLDASLNPTGQIETYSGQLSGGTTNERGETLERATAWVGPARVRVRRVTPHDYDFAGGVVDEIEWIDLYGVAPVTKPHFGNKTIVHTVTHTTAGSAAVQRRELNCLASRRIPIYNAGSGTFSGTFDADGQLVSGTISASSRIIDILAAVTIDPKIGNRPLSDLDLGNIATVQAALDAWHPQAGQFNYTFDSDTLSFEETAMAIANAAFCVPYRQNGKIRLALDRPQAASVALFTHRNKRPKAETITRTFTNDAEYDGIEFVYVDPETETQETIRLPLDASYTKLKKIEITGIRSYEQAWFRANREYQRLIGQRLSVDTECTTDARALLPNSRVDIVDNTRFRSWDGEVIAQSGLTLTLSREVEFVPAAPHSIVLMKRNGTIQSIACTPGPQANQVVLAAAPAEAIVTEDTNEGGIRTIFSFAADSARAAQAWLVQEIGATDGPYVRIRAVNYSDSYYAADAQPIPAKASIIN